MLGALDILSSEVFGLVPFNFPRVQYCYTV